MVIENSASLVSAQWLAANLDHVVVLDASISREVDDGGQTAFRNGAAVFAAGHIPGARFADILDAFSQPDAPFPFTRPTAAHLREGVRALGISDDTEVIVYDSLTGAWAARVWWILRSFGLDTVRVLDGGLGAWKRLGLRVESGAPAPVAPGSFVARDRSGFFTPHDEVKALAAQRGGETALVCALRRSDYLGEDSKDPRAGHIPGSESVPYPELLLADGRIDVATARARWQALGLDARKRAVLYCGGGITAAGLALVLTQAGYEGMTIYDGSLSEWRADETLPMARGMP